jgi:signal transduction histidine kinase/DNA-binding NarL/FixJ family response regulator
MNARRRLITGWFPPGAAIVLIWTALFLYLSGQRIGLLDGGRTNTANLAHAFEESLSRTIREIDQTLLYVRALRTHEGNNVDLRPWIESTDPENRLAAQISMTDQFGIVTLSNLHQPSKRIDLSDRPHFRHFADHPDDHLYVSVPVLGRVSSVMTIQFVRMLMTPSGGFDGIIVLSILPDYLVRLYSAVDIGKDGRIAMIGLDGIIRARAGGASAVGQSATGPVVEMARHADSGQFRWIDPDDNVARIGSFRRVAGYPFIVAIEMSERELGASANRAIPGYLTVAILLTSVIIGLGITAARQRRQAKAAHELIKLALEHVGVGVMVVDPLGRIDMFNSRAGAMLGFSPDIVAGSQYRQLIDWQNRNGELTSEHMASEVLAAKLGSRPWCDVPPVFRRSLPDGRIIETRTEALEDGTTVRSFTDMTAAEETQRILTEARDTAEAAVRARAQFLAAMSDEFRTPLNGILGGTELMCGTAMTDEQKSYADIIQHAGTHLLEMLSEILDYSEIDQRGVDLDIIPYSPGAVLREVVAMRASSTVSHDFDLGVEIVGDLPELVLGDPYRVRQVLLNLVNNAIKFTRSGRVDVSLTGVPLGDGRWRLSFAVRDTGIGIEPEALERLFREFTQTDGSITRRFGGTGLGLVICRHVVQAMGGNITVESTPGKGSTFGFDIPVDAVPANTAAKVTAADRPSDAATFIAGRSPVVLLAEDNPVNRLVAKRMLERIDCQVVIAENGLEAVEAVRKGGIDLVLMDVMMPKMDGLAATRAIRALASPLNTIPIIGLSANAFRSDEDDGRAAGMDSFVTKPIDRARLVAEIAVALKVTAVAPSPEARAARPLRQLREALGDETADAVIAAFRADAPKMLLRLRLQAEARSAAGVAREAHALAGTVGALGLTDLSGATREMERGARRMAIIPNAEMLDALEARFASEIAAMDTETVA